MNYACKRSASMLYSPSFALTLLNREEVHLFSPQDTSKGFDQGGCVFFLCHKLFYLI